MIRSAASKVMWVGRATVFLVGLAVILALVFGVASTAFAHSGYRGLFHLGHNNPIAKVTTLVGNVATGSALVVKNPSGGSALGLEVNAGQAPLTVNADAGKATNLDADKLDGKSQENFYAAGSKVANSDKLDGKDSTQLGVNGWQKVVASSDYDSSSRKTAVALCPSGKVVVGTAYDIFGAPGAVVVDGVTVSSGPPAHFVHVEAREIGATPDDWQVTAVAICAQAP